MPPDPFSPFVTLCQIDEYFAKMFGLARTVNFFTAWAQLFVAHALQRAASRLLDAKTSARQPEARAMSPGALTSEVRA
jgi:hypothetical protein